MGPKASVMSPTNSASPRLSFVLFFCLREENVIHRKTNLIIPRVHIHVSNHSFILLEVAQDNLTAQLSAPVCPRRKEEKKHCFKFSCRHNYYQSAWYITLYVYCAEVSSMMHKWCSKNNILSDYGHLHVCRCRLVFETWFLKFWCLFICEWKFNKAFQSKIYTKVHRVWGLF